MKQLKNGWILWENGQLFLISDMTTAMYMYNILVHKFDFTKVSNLHEKTSNFL